MWLAPLPHPAGIQNRESGCRSAYLLRFARCLTVVEDADPQRAELETHGRAPARI
jgi:hypothetical protein